jgi:hypothetical protein
LKEHTVTPAYNGTARNSIFSVASRFYCMHVLEVKDFAENADVL